MNKKTKHVITFIAFKVVELILIALLAYSVWRVGGIWFHAPCNSNMSFEDYYPSNMSFEDYYHSDCITNSVGTYIFWRVVTGAAAVGIALFAVYLLVISIIKWIKWNWEITA